MPLTTLSQSSLQDFAECPRRFQLRYLEQLAYPAIETEPALENEQRLLQGERFHQMARQRFLGLPLEQICKQANTPELQLWWENFLNASIFAQPPEALYPEWTLSAPLPPYRLLAKFDLLARLPEGRFLIYDWKTYRQRPPNHQLAARWQTRIYCALLARAGNQLNGGTPIQPEQIEMVYWFTDFPDQVARFPYSTAQYRRDWDALQRLAAEIASAEEFPLTQEERHCARCTYRSCCNRGTQAGEGEPEEIGLYAQLDLDQIGEIPL